MKARDPLALGMLVLAILAAFAVSGWAASGAGAAGFEDFGIEAVSAEESTSAAGMHPDLTTEVVFNHEEAGGLQESIGRMKDLAVELPPGFAANTNAFPQCTTGQFLAVNCPIGSQVGIVEVLISGSPEPFTEPLYDLTLPNPDSVARLGFFAVTFPTYIEASVRTASDNRITATVRGASAQVPIVSAKTILWGSPADPSHDPLRLTPLEARFGCHTACLAPGEARSSGLTPVPFTSNPSACESQSVGFAATSYELPGQVFRDSAALPPTAGCANVPFDPSLRVEPTSRRAGAPTGLRTVLQIPQTSALNVPSSSALRDARVTLPPGMAISPAVADGLAACSSAQVGLGREVGSACPDAAKLGVATFLSPDLPAPLHGSVYQRTPEPGHLFGLWLVADELGMHLKLPGEIEADRRTGQLTAVFHETPQLPVAEIDLELKGGARAPLVNPSSCGSYETRYELAPWSGGATVSGSSAMTIDQGCGGRGFSPGLAAGVTRPVAGSYSPFLLDLTRGDAEQDIGSFDVTLPPGELAKLAGVPVCPEAAAANGACPAGSRVGSVDVATGAGPQPLWLPQPGREATAVFLAGPYEGAPNSFVTRVPAQAGPFDLGTVVVRSGIYLDPETAQITVRTDPLPQILEGVPLDYRAIHFQIDRRKFAISPTNCREISVAATVTSTEGAVAHPADRFQVGECATLPFAPRLALRLQGGTGRGAHPALTATLKMKAGEANVRRASVALPHSEFLAQEHIDTVCTRVQFAAGNCPAGSVYGHARAFTPLLEEPLEGPVYLRSSDHPLPDLVLDLHGPADAAIRIVLAGRIDSVKGALRTTFAALPDAPLSFARIEFFGGKRGLIELSDGLCAHPRATTRLTGQNAKTHDTRPVVKTRCPPKDAATSPR